MSGGVPVRCVGVEQVYRIDGRDVVALTGVDLDVAAGESVTLFGPSGSGKSTLTALLAGLRRPTRGQVYLGDAELTALSERALLRLRGQLIGIVLQNPGRSLLPYGTAEENIAFARRALPRARRAGLPEPVELLDGLGLRELAGRRVGAMSGGEQQRLSVAVAMACAPGLLLADEPTSQLDAGNRDRVVELLQQVRGATGATTVLVTHDRVVAEATDRVVTLADGRIVDGGAVVSPGRHAAADRAQSPRGHRTLTHHRLATTSVGLVRDGRTVLDGIDLDVVPGQALAVVGPSGSGKSSLLALLAGLEAPDSGRVHRGGGRVPLRQGLILQGYGLVGVLSAAENVEAPLQAGALGRLDRAEVRDRATAALLAVGLDGVADHLVEELSGGQQQRVAIARALVVDPAVVLADEPTAELDRDWKRRVIDLLLAVAERGGTVVVATHDPEVAGRCGRRVRIVDGRLAGEDGGAEVDDGGPAAGGPVDGP